MQKKLKHTQISYTLSADVRYRNQKEEARLQMKLDHLNFRYRVVMANLYQETATIMKEHENLFYLRGTTHKATVDNTMNEVRRIKKDLNNSADLLEYDRASSPKSEYMTGHPRAWSGYSFRSRLKPNSRSSMTEQASSYSTANVRQRPKSTISLPGRSAISCLEADLQVLTCKQLQSIATIDNISRKEMIKQKENEEEEKRKMRSMMESSLNQRIADFLSKLKSSERKRVES
ncbi:uncharacterized protein LOC120526893 [Polypterus senegalus]|uniref:uncharacterized protein LOC120526893 n=1 Tax=Polypterus senegalus TaxID=55291 RepID=UPI0019647484|nr:uncharacterized protein LOC120526893 [Polypterus senegalus]